MGGKPYLIQCNNTHGEKEQPNNKPRKSLERFLKAELVFQRHNSEMRAWLITYCLQILNSKPATEEYSLSNAFLLHLMVVSHRQALNSLHHQRHRAKMYESNASRVKVLPKVIRSLVSYGKL